VVDFNGDGLNDLVLVTEAGVYGYVQVRGRQTRQPYRGPRRALVSAKLGNE
jgi:hypothetical protein